jgi:hypothetical protein
MPFNVLSKKYIGKVVISTFLVTSSLGLGFVNSDQVVYGAGAGTISALTVPTISANSTSEALGTIRLTVPNYSFSGGDVAVINLPNGFHLPTVNNTLDFYQGVATVTSATYGQNYVYSSSFDADTTNHIQVQTLSDNQIKITMPQTVHQSDYNSDPQFNVYLGNIVANGANNGPVNAIISASSTGAFPSGTIVIGVINDSTSTITPPQPANYKVLINGQEVTFDSGVYERNGVVFGSLRGLVEALGVQATWDSADQKITFNAPNKTLVLTIGNTSGLLNGQQIILPEAPTIVDGRTIVPLKAIVEAFGGTIEIKPLATAPTVDGVNSTSTVVTGRGQVGSTITVKVGSNVIGSGTVKSDGTFSITIPLQTVGTSLGVVANDDQGNESKTVNVTVQDSQPPQSANYKVLINGQEVVFDSGVYEKNGTVFGALRGLAEALNLQVNWDATTQQITFISTDKTLVLTVGSKQGVLNGVSITLPEEPIIVNGRTIVPLQAIVEAFGGTIEIINGSHSGGGVITVTKVPRANNGFEGEISQVVIKSDYPIPFTQGDLFSIILPNGLTWGDSYTTDGTVTGATYHRVTDRELNFTVTGSPNQITIPLNVRVNGANNGPLNAIITAPSSSSIPNGTVTILSMVSESIVTPPNVNSISTTDKVVTGTSQAGTTITVKSQDIVLGQVTTRTDGSFSVNIPSQPTGTVLTIIASDQAGNVSQATSVTVIQDECFIATASFGSKMEPSVVTLRQFRDRYLMTNSFGQSFVKFYYKYSPPIARNIAGNEVKKGIVRLMLTPLVCVAKTMLNQA